MKHVEEWAIRIIGLISMITTFVTGGVLAYKVGETVVEWTCKVTLGVGGWFINVLKKKGFDIGEK